MLMYYLQFLINLMYYLINRLIYLCAIVFSEDLLSIYYALVNTKML